MQSISWRSSEGITFSSDGTVHYRAENGGRSRICRSSNSRFVYRAVRDLLAAGDYGPGLGGSRPRAMAGGNGAGAAMRRGSIPARPEVLSHRLQRQLYRARGGDSLSRLFAHHARSKPHHLGKLVAAVGQAARVGGCASERNANGGSLRPRKPQEGSSDCDGHVFRRNTDTGLLAAARSRSGKLRGAAGDRANHHAATHCDAMTEFFRSFLLFNYRLRARRGENAWAGHLLISIRVGVRQILESVFVGGFRARGIN